MGLSGPGSALSHTFMVCLRLRCHLAFCLLGWASSAPLLAQKPSRAALKVMRAQKDRGPTRTRERRVISDGINGTRADTDCPDRTWLTLETRSNAWTREGAERGESGTEEYVDN